MESPAAPSTARKVRVLESDQWQPLRDRHARLVETWTGPHRERRRRGIAHPVEDFLFSYYSFRPGALQRWHPGFGTAIRGATEYAALPGYAEIDGLGGAVAVTAEHVRQRRSLISSIRTLLVATADREPQFGCFGLHEWAMVYRLAPDRVRHAAWPLRLGPERTDAVVDGHRVACSHFDAVRFFADAARPLNTLSPQSEDRAAFEQPGCLHAGMDLYKHAFRMTPMLPAELVADCFALAREIRVLDMRASPYDLSGLGYEPVPIEAPEGKQVYVRAQREFAQRAAPLRRRLVEACDRLLAVDAHGP